MEEIKKVSKKTGNNTEIIVIRTDITTLAVDAIVNAANENLLGGEGVDGAIHKAAGPELLEECRRIGACKAGEAVITPAYKLPAKYVVHTVGPKYGSENGKEDILLSGCYKNSLARAFEKNLVSIAFPNISTGIYRYPKEEAVEIAFKAVIDWIENHDFYAFEQIYFVSYTEEDYNMNSFYFEQLEI